MDINRDKNKTGTPFQGDRWVLAAQYNTYVENIPLFESSSRWAHLKIHRTIQSLQRIVLSMLGLINILH